MSDQERELLRVVTLRTGHGSFRDLILAAQDVVTAWDGPNLPGSGRCDLARAIEGLRERLAGFPRPREQ